MRATCLLAALLAFAACAAEEDPRLVRGAGQPPLGTGTTPPPPDVDAAPGDALPAGDALPSGDAGGDPDAGIPDDDAGLPTADAGGTPDAGAATPF